MQLLLILANDLGFLLVVLRFADLLVPGFDLRFQFFDLAGRGAKFFPVRVVLARRAHGVWLRRRFHCPGFDGLLLPQPVLVAANVFANYSRTFKNQRTGNGIVDEFAVVTDQQQRAAILDNQFLE